MPWTILFQQLDSALWQGRWAPSAHSWPHCSAKGHACTSESMFKATLHIVDQVPLRKTENLTGFFFPPVELPGKPYILSKENPSLCVGSTFPAMAVHVQARYRQEGFVWISVVGNTFYKIWVTQAENQGTTNGRRIWDTLTPEFSGVYPFFPFHHCTEGVKIYSAPAFLTIFTLLDTLPASTNLVLPSLTLSSWKAMETHKHWVQLNFWSKQDQTFSQREEKCLYHFVSASGLQSDQPQSEMRAAPWLLSSRPGIRGVVAHPHENWGFSCQFLSQAFRPVSFWNSEKNREDLGLCCTHSKMSTAPNASRQEVSVNRFFSFLPFASLQFLFQ